MTEYEIVSSMSEAISSRYSLMALELLLEVFRFMSIATNTSTSPINPITGSFIASSSVSSSMTMMSGFEFTDKNGFLPDFLFMISPFTPVPKMHEPIRK